MYTKDIKRIEKKIIVSILMSGLLFFAVSRNVTANDISVNMVIKELNEARTLTGLSPLVKNAKLSEAAEAKIQDMLASDYFAHTSPTGVDPWYWLGKSGYVYTYAGENLAMDFRTAEDQQAAWMKSPTHRKNMLSTDFQEVGVAVRQGMLNGHMTTITVQEFGARKDFPVFAKQENEGLKVAKEVLVSDGKVLGAQSIGLSALSLEFSTIFAGVNSSLAVGAISGWTLILFGIAMSLMGITAVYLVFDIHRLRKEERLAKKMQHQNMYYISDDEYTQLLESFSVKSMELKKHHSQ